MFQINAHTIPTKESDQYGKVVGAYAVIYINYPEIDGAFELAKFYIKENGWIIEELEDDYYVIKSKEDLDDDQIEFYQEALKDGFSMIFHCYESEDDEK
jgi:hypothetical protein